MSEMSQETNQKRNFLFKIVVVGDGGVGKSTMIQRLITGKFIAQKITIGTDLATFSIEYDENISIKLQIWDFAGEKRFRFFLPNYARGALGCLLCYDISRYTSFQSLNEWYTIVKENAGEAVFVLVGGKVDLSETKRSVSQEQAEEFKDKNDISYFFETSSKSGENNKQIFETLTQAIIKKKNLLP